MSQRVPRRPPSQLPKLPNRLPRARGNASWVTDDRRRGPLETTPSRAREATRFASPTNGGGGLVAATPSRAREAMLFGSPTNGAGGPVAATPSRAREATRFASPTNGGGGLVAATPSRPREAAHRGSQTIGAADCSGRPPRAHARQCSLGHGG
jgi:hypothetical protein